MRRIIEIKGCNECPNRDHQGGFAKVSYVPICRAANDKELPYNVGMSYGVVVASGTNQIPDWCPLEKID